MVFIVGKIYEWHEWHEFTLKEQKILTNNWGYCWCYVIPDFDKRNKKWISKSFKIYKLEG